jgi:hypothetical protein
MLHPAPSTQPRPPIHPPTPTLPPPCPPTPQAPLPRPHSPLPTPRPHPQAPQAQLTQGAAPAAGTLGRLAAAAVRRAAAPRCRHALQRRELHCGLPQHLRRRHALGWGGGGGGGGGRQQGSGVGGDGGGRGAAQAWPGALAWPSPAQPWQRRVRPHAAHAAAPARRRAAQAAAGQVRTWRPSCATRGEGSVAVMSTASSTYV